MAVVDAAGPSDIWLKSVGDLNGDGRPDLVAGGHGGGGLVWYENPTWTAHAIDDVVLQGCHLPHTNVPNPGN